MRIIGLTGSIATGKSTVSRCLSTDHNLPIIDADKIARQVVSPSQPAHRRIVKALGTSILEPNNSQNLDRPKLANLVFRDPSVRKKVNGATHPYIRLEMLRQLLWAFLTLKSCVVLDTPLLFEAGIDKWVHVVMVVYCPEETQKQRLMKRDDLSEIEATQRISAQMPIERKKEMAHIVIDNSLGVRETRARVSEVVGHLKPSLISTVLAWLVLGWPAAIVWAALTAIKILKI
ncbi:hypothetical protein HDV05_007128 [Chytridiales sp. JEL 0842]|nr:hypothetical protein HDV05_007128 [Chytridiales sp. JEL 0842]